MHFTVHIPKLLYIYFTEKKQLKRKITSLFLIFTILICPSLTYCNKKDITDKNSTTTDNNFYYSFIDSLGNNITLTKKPKKVAVLFSSFADIWMLSGGNISITVGDSIARGFANNDVILVDDGAGHSAINTEILISEMPDLVIATADYPVQKETAEYLNSIGIPAATFKIESFDDYVKVLRIFTDINNRADIYINSGKKLKDRITSLIENIKNITEGKEKTNILFIRAGSSSKSTKAKNSNDNFVCKMLNELNAHNIADDAPVLLDGLSLESIVMYDPEYIFITSMGNEEASHVYINDLFSKDGWNTLSAVKNGKVIFLEKELFHYKPNAHWYEAYEFLAKTLYPNFN